jgi:hypothetical protein
VNYKTSILIDRKKFLILRLQLSKMEVAMQKFPKGLPTLEELKKWNTSDVPPETAWIWGKDDEVNIYIYLSSSNLKAD